MRFDARSMKAGEKEAGAPLLSGRSHVRQAIHMQAGPFCPHRTEDLAHLCDLTRRNGMARRNPPRTVSYFFCEAEIKNEF